MKESELICPMCGKEMRVWDLLSWPAQYEAECECGFSLKYHERDNSEASITQKEIDEFYLKHK